MFSRRQFLKNSSHLVAGVFAANASLILPQRVDDSLQYAGIGLGIRGSGIVNDAANFAQCVALCDVDSNHLANSLNKLNKNLVSKDRAKMNPATSDDYQETLQRDDIDFVVIGTPDHWHAKMAIEAMLAGKDVYCEKPLTLTISEGQQIVEVQKKTGRVFHWDAAKIRQKIPTGSCLGSRKSNRQGQKNHLRIGRSAKIQSLANL